MDNLSQAAVLILNGVRSIQGPWKEIWVQQVDGRWRCIYDDFILPMSNNLQLESLWSETDMRRYLTDHENIVPTLGSLEEYDELVAECLL